MTVRREIAELLAGWKTKGIASVGSAPCVTEPSPPAFSYLAAAPGALGAVVAAAGAAGAVSFATAG